MSWLLLRDIIKGAVQVQFVFPISQTSWEAFKIMQKKHISKPVTYKKIVILFGNKLF